VSVGRQLQHGKKIEQPKNLEVFGSK